MVHSDDIVLLGSAAGVSRAVARLIAPSDIGVSALAIAGLLVGPSSHSLRTKKTGWHVVGNHRCRKTCTLGRPTLDKFGHAARPAAWWSSRDGTSVTIS